MYWTAFCLAYSRLLPLIQPLALLPSPTRLFVSFVTRSRLSSLLVAYPRSLCVIMSLCFPPPPPLEDSLHLLGKSTVGAATNRS
jgi:hypothetical protein